MKNNIQYSPEALKDLDDIWDYIFSELCNPDAADHTINAILDTADQLETFSNIGTLLSAITEIESDYRFLVSGNYLIFYRSYSHEVYIDRILYSKRDYLRILFPDLPQELE